MYVPFVFKSPNLFDMITINLSNFLVNLRYLTNVKIFFRWKSALKFFFAKKKLILLHFFKRGMGGVLKWSAGSIFYTNFLGNLSLVTTVITDTPPLKGFHHKDNRFSSQNGLLETSSGTPFEYIRAQLSSFTGQACW